MQAYSVRVYGSACIVCCLCTVVRNVYGMFNRKSSKDLLCGSWNPTAEMYLIMRDVPVRALHMTPDVTSLTRPLAPRPL